MDLPLSARFWDDVGNSKILSHTNESSASSAATDTPSQRKSEVVPGRLASRGNNVPISAS